MALEVVCNAETEEDMSVHADALLKVRAIALMGETFIEQHIELTEGYYELQAVFQTIRLLIEPALTFFCYEGPELVKKS